MAHRYEFTYGNNNDYLVIDNQTKKPIYSSVSKSRAIARAQEANRFKPLDGDEQTSARQIKE